MPQTLDITTGSPLIDDLAYSQSDFQRIAFGEDYGDDEQVRANLRVAVDWVERETNRAIFPTRRTARLGPCARGVTLWPTPLLAVENVTYVDRNGVTLTLDPAMYRVVADEQPGRVDLCVPGGGLPDSADPCAPVTITYCTGYADAAAVPPTLLAAVRILASHLFENREAATVVQLHEVPMGVRRIMDLHRFVRVEGE